MKVLRSVLVGIMAAFAATVAAAALLPALGIAVSSTMSLFVMLGGFAVGYAASAFESSALYAVVAGLVILSMFAIFFSGSMASGSWVADLMLKITSSQGWMGYAIWFGGHIVAVALLAQWVSDPSLSISEAVAKTASDLTEVVAATAVGVTTGVLTSLWEVATDNPWVFAAAGAAVWYLGWGRYAAAGRILGSEKAAPYERRERPIPQLERAEPVSYVVEEEDRQPLPQPRPTSDPLMDEMEGAVIL